MEYKKFNDACDQAAAFFKRWASSKPIQVVSHLDADGISSCAILIKSLNRINHKYVLSIIPQLTKEKIQELAQENTNYVIFSDLGSGLIKDIAEIMHDKEILVLDHHEPEEGNVPYLYHLNPHLYGIDGSKEISGAGVVYFFAKALDLRNEDLAHIAVIGALGDIQEEDGFCYLNEQILKTAIAKGTIKVSTGLRFFGMQTKPIHKLLEYSTDPYIPGVSGSESGAVQFLNQIGIEPKVGSSWKKAIDLTEEEMKKLVSGIIMKRFGESSPEDVLGNIYTLPHEEEGSPTRDAREFATLLNACGRMDKASFGMGACLGIPKDRKRALETLSGYKREIVNSLNWYDKHKDSFIKGDGFMIINAKDEILSTVIGTLASIISKSGDITDGTYILSLARSKDGFTKVSLRMSGMNGDADLREVVKSIVNEIGGGEAGGHKYAAGALINTEDEATFVSAAEKILMRINRKL